MRFFLTSVFTISVAFSINAQCINSYPILTTDPAVSNQQRNGQGKVNNFDWTRDVYDDVFVTQQPNGSNPVCTVIYAPWHNTQLNNLNVRELVLQRAMSPITLDVYPKDGWELLTIKMGREVLDPDGNKRSEPVQNPSFSIYNRRTGHIKYFIYVTSTTYSSPRVLNITLKYTYNSIGRKIVGAMLNHRDSLQFELPEFNPNIEQMAQSQYDGVPRPNEACNGTGYWLAADFWTQFDPCTCYPDFAAKVEFYTEFMDNKTITMKIDGDLTGSFVNSLYGSPIYFDNGSIQKSKFDGILGNTSASIDGILKGYKTASGFNDYAMKLVSPKVVNGVTKPPLLKGVAAKKVLAKGAVFGPKGLLIAGGIGLVHSLIKANKVKKDKVIPEQSFRFETPKPISYERNFKVNMLANGTILSMPQVIPEAVFVPGSPNQPNAFLSSKPIYNNVLGILSFTELPRLEYAKWNLEGFENNFFQYKLKDSEIKYIVNPASGLAIESMQAQLVINLDGGGKLPPTDFRPPIMDYMPPFRGPFQFGNTPFTYCDGVDDFEKKINASGLEISNWPSEAKSYREITFGTPFVDLPCVHDQTFLLNEIEAQNLRVAIKFHVIFRVSNEFGAISIPEDASTNDDEELIEYIVTYNLDIDEKPINEAPLKVLSCVKQFPDDSQPSCYEYVSRDHLGGFGLWYRLLYFLNPLDPSPWPNISNREVLPVSLNFENTTLSGNQEFKAQKTITIGNNVKVINGSNIYLKAGESIEVSDLLEGEELIHMAIGLDPLVYIGACDPSSYNTTPDLNAICQTNGTYHQKTRSLSKNEDPMDFIVKEEIEIVRNVTSFPNPATEFTNIHFDITNDSRITIELQDIKGQLVNRLASNKFYPIGTFEIPLNLQGLNQGVYIVAFTVENGLKKAYKVVKH